MGYVVKRNAHLPSLESGVANGARLRLVGELQINGVTRWLCRLLPVRICIAWVGEERIVAKGTHQHAPCYKKQPPHPWTKVETRAQSDINSEKCYDWAFVCLKGSRRAGIPLRAPKIPARE